MALKWISAGLEPVAWLTLLDQGFSAGLNRVETFAEGLKLRV